MNSLKIYVASSWRNLMQQGVVHTLRAALAKARGEEAPNASH